MASLLNFTKHLKKNTKTSQTFPKIEEGEYFPKHFISQYYPNSKPKTWEENYRLVFHVKMDIKILNKI